MTMITLTQKGNGKAIAINPALVTVVLEGTDSCSIYFTGDTAPTLIKQSYLEVVGMLQGAK